MPRSAKLQKIATALFNQVRVYYFETLIGVENAAVAYGFLKMKTFSLDEKIANVQGLVIETEGYLNHVNMCFVCMFYWRTGTRNTAV